MKNRGLTDPAMLAHFKIGLVDGTKAYVAKNSPIIMMTSKGGRFDLKIGILPPGVNIDVVRNGKNTQLFESESGSPSRANLMAAIGEIYNSVAANYDRLLREREARKSALMSRLHPNAAPLTNSASATSQSPMVRVADVQPQQAGTPVEQRETGVSPWIYGVVVVIVAAFIGAWFVIRSKR